MNNQMRFLIVLNVHIFVLLTQRTRAAGRIEPKEKKSGNHGDVASIDPSEPTPATPAGRYPLRQREGRRETWFEMRPLFNVNEVNRLFFMILYQAAK